MDISQFMFRLLNKLNENEFYNIEVYKDYIKKYKKYKIKILATRDCKSYYHCFIIGENCLDNNKIDEIVNHILWW